MSRAILSVALAAAIVPFSASCFDRSRYLPTSPAFQGALSLSATPAAIPADGFATAAITAEITPDAAPSRRIVMFESTSGTFAGSGPPEIKTTEASVNDQGTVTVFLRSSRNIESAVVTAKVKGVDGIAKQVVVGFMQTNPSDIIRLSPERASAPADGATVTPITATIHAGLPSGRRRVTFTTTRGTFMPSPGSGAPQEEGRIIDADADASNRAVAYLRSASDGVGEVLLSARVDNSPAVSASASMQFTLALPQNMVVTTDDPSLTASFSSTTQVTATLRRDTGVPTQGQQVRFSAVDAGGSPINFFSRITMSNSGGVVTATFTPGSAAVPGQATIRATLTETGLTTSTVIQVLPFP